MGRKIIDVPKIIKQKDTKHPNKSKINNPPVHILSKTNPDPNNPIVEDVSNNQPHNREPSTSIPTKEKEEDPSELDLETTSAHNPTLEEKKNTENPSVRNAKT